MSSRTFFASVEAALVTGALMLAWGVWRLFPPETESVPVAAVHRGPRTLVWTAQGEVRAAHAELLRAPVAFGAVRVVKLAPPGSFAAPNDLIAEFDASGARGGIEDRRIESERLAAQIAKARAKMELDASADEAAVSGARFAIRRAELEVKRNELLPPAEARRNVQMLEDARARLARILAGSQTRKAQDVAELVLLSSRAADSANELDRERRRVDQMRLVAPQAGWVAFSRAAPDPLAANALAPRLREGDEVSAGAPVAEIRDPSRLVLAAWANESEQARLRIGQTAQVRLDACPGGSLRGEVTSIAAAAPEGQVEAREARYEVLISLDMPAVLECAGLSARQAAEVLASSGPSRDSSAVLARAPAARFPWSAVPRPGTLGRVDVITGHFDEAISIPRASAFSSGGVTFVWVKRGGGFRRQTIKTVRGDDDWIVIAGGMRAGDEVALAQPPARSALP